MTAPTISACIVCRNEADRLPAALESVRWADEMVVMDLESTDGSMDVARAHGARVVMRATVPIVEMVRNEVAAHATGEWILVLDPDERISPALADELRRAAVRDDVDAVIMPRMNCDLGYPPSDPLERYEQQLRMYRRSAVAWPTVPNAVPTVPPERIHRVRSADDLVIVHDRSRNIPEVVDRIQRYAVLQAQSMIDQGQVFSARAMVASLGSRAARKFLHGQAWRDGVPGLLRAGILVGFHFYIWAAFWQLSGARRTPEDDRFVRRLGIALEAARRAFNAALSPYRAVTRVSAALRRRR
ncbi:MAG TPA: glycosyltransferase family 2 protein [Gemmatimonadales bacterium]